LFAFGLPVCDWLKQYFTEQNPSQPAQEPFPEASSQQGVTALESAFLIVRPNRLIFIRE